MRILQGIIATVLIALPFSTSNTNKESSNSFTYVESCNVLFPAIDGEEDFSNLFILNDDGSVSGYYGDYLTTLSQQASIKFNYIIPKDLDECSLMVNDFIKNGGNNSYGIDIVANCRKEYFEDLTTVTLSTVFDCEAPVYLFTQADNDTISEFDYSTYENKIIGLLRSNTTLNNSFYNFAETNSLYSNDGNTTNDAMKVIYYDDETAYKNAFINHDIDIIINRSSFQIDQLRTLSSIFINRSYLAVVASKPNVYQRINSQMIQLRDNQIEIIQSLISEWFPTRYDKIVLNDEEKAYLKTKNNKLNVGYKNEFQPYLAKNSNNQYEGLIVDYISKFSSVLGLDINYVSHEGDESELKGLDSGEFDFLFGRNSYHAADSYFDTNKYLSFDVYYISNIKTQVSIDRATSIGIYAVGDTYSSIVNNAKFYDSLDQMLTDVDNGTIDGCMTSLLSYNHGKYDLRLDNIVTQEMFGEYSISFVTTTTNHLLHSILNKCIHYAYANYYETLINDYQNKINYKTTFSDFVHANMTVFIAVIIVTIAILITFIVVLAVSISRSRSVNKQLEILSTTDQLTGLYNRTKLMKYSSKLIHDKIPFTLIILDLNNFKSINDIYGHTAGDRVLMTMANKFKTIDPENTSIFRYGGDEFLFISKSYKDDEIITFANKINQLSSQIIYIDKNNSVEIQFSFGISCYPKDSETLDQLIQQSDSAMYEIKNKKISGYEVFSKEKEYYYERLNYVKEILVKALAENRIYMVFQPLIDIKENKLAGFESLMRIRNETISPQEFIHVAEETGLISRLGEIALSDSIDFEARLKKLGYKGIYISINVSAQQLYNYELIDKSLDLFAKKNIAVNEVVFEMTESVFFNKKLIDNISTDERYVYFINNVRLALDDFGTGYSSITNLLNYKYETIKFDKSITDRLPDNGNTINLINFIHNYNFKVLAEGVETIAQLNYLKNAGCDLIQGYYFSKPLEADDAIAYLKEFNKGK